jgi:Asp-tRNA(Asn)/Glu-tRNA(Gln) amidotransferase A subunit family amidase
MAHAADGFGSIRVPASCCGLVGLKPTRARNSLGPTLGEAVAGLVAEHAVTLSVRDCAAVLDATAGPAPGDPYSAPPPTRPFLQEVGTDPGRLRVAFTTGRNNGAETDADCLAALQEAATLCGELGHHVEEADPPIENALAWQTFVTLVSANMWITLNSHPGGRTPQRDELENVTWATAKIGERLAAGAYIQATQTAHRLGRQMAAFHTDHDVLLTPALGTLPVRLGWLDMMMDDVEDYWARVARFTPFTVWFNLTGQPAMTIPMGWTDGGLPLSVQAVAPLGEEAVLFRLASQIEAARPWRQRKPGLVTQPMGTLQP